MNFGGQESNLIFSDGKQNCILGLCLSLSSCLKLSVHAVLLSKNHCLKVRAAFLFLLQISFSPCAFSQAIDFPNFYLCLYWWSLGNLLSVPSSLFGVKDTAMKIPYLPSSCSLSGEGSRWVSDNRQMVMSRGWGICEIGMAYQNPWVGVQNFNLGFEKSEKMSYWTY